jgi:hypothetical protein
MERALWSDGGYYLDNGVSVCAEHHLVAERTMVSPDELRERAGITHVLLPPQLDEGTKWDKWGNPYLSDGSRGIGEMFYQPQVQKILRPVLSDFKRYMKYPRTPHVPFSPGTTSDDRILSSLDAFVGREVVISLKMDGENTSIYSDGHTHARSLDSSAHPSRSYVAQVASRVSLDLPPGWRLCGENLFAVHSLKYETLEDYFYGFSLWNEVICLDWDTTLTWFELLNVTPVPTLYRGIFDESVLRSLFKESYDGLAMEGWVMRDAGAFTWSEFPTRVAKFVRKGHVTTGQHWMTKAVERNGLR